MEAMETAVDEAIETAVIETAVTVTGADAIENDVVPGVSKNPRDDDLAVLRNLEPDDVPAVNDANQIAAVFPNAPVSTVRL